MKVKSESEVAQSYPTQRPHGLKPTRLLHPWDFPGKSTGVGCHCLLRVHSNTQNPDMASQAVSLPEAAGTEGMFALAGTDTLEAYHVWVEL